MTDRHPVWKLADAIQMDLRAASAKLVELRAHLASLELPDETKLICDRCGLGFHAQVTLDEHLYNSHNGPEPPHWLAIEALSVEPAPAHWDTGQPELASAPGAKETQT